MIRILAVAASVVVGALAGLSGVASAGPRSGCTDLGGNVQSGNYCHVYLATPAYTVDLRFGTDYLDDQAVAGYLTQERDRVVNLAQKPGAQNLPYELFSTSKSYSSGQRLGTTQAQLGYGQPPHGTQSLVLRLYHDYEGASVGMHYKTFTYDLNHNRPVTFADLFAPGSNPMDAIYPAVAADLERQHMAYAFKLPSGIGRDPKLYQNFAITDDAVIFFFDTLELLPQEEEDYSATVSRANLPPLQV